MPWGTLLVTLAFRSPKSLFPCLWHQVTACLQLNRQSQEVHPGRETKQMKLHYTLNIAQPYGLWQKVKHGPWVHESMSGCGLSNALNSKSRWTWWTSYLTFLSRVHRLLEVRTAPILCGFHEAQSFGMISTSSTQVPRGFVANLRASNGHSSCREGHFNFRCCGLHRWTLTRNCMQCRHCLPASFFTLMISLSNALLCWGRCWNACHCGEPLKKI